MSELTQEQLEARAIELQLKFDPYEGVQIMGYMKAKLEDLPLPAPKLSSVIGH